MFSLLTTSTFAETKPDLDQKYDLVVYGGTSGGIAAAIQASRMDKSVLLIEPTEHLGGLSSGGLGATDIGNKGAIGGISLEFYQNIKKYYDTQSNWKQEKPSDFKGYNSSDEAMWKFEPHVAELIFNEMLKEADVPVLSGERLDLKSGVVMEQGAIQQIVMESGKRISGHMFLDTTYEGDLMAVAGVSFHVGREANATYGETLNGIQTKNAVSHQFEHEVDPYIKPGNSASGVLPGINPEPLAVDGTGDHRVQAYCFRMCTTDAVENQADWVKPEEYDPLQYELLFRNFEAGDRRIPWNPIFMPNRKTDTNNNYAISTDYIGMNFDYPNASYEERDEIFRQHLIYQQGLMWSLANHARVPEEVREHFQRLKPAKDEFTDHNNWPHQLYIREARRLISDYVMTQHDCQGRTVPKDAVGLAAYTMDSHNIQRHIVDGHVINEGDVQVGGFSPYPISYRSIRPRKSECRNLLVPMCLSASHIAYGSIRMEPVFMVLGQSAATAAMQAIDAKVDVQDISIKELQNKLKEDKQVLAWTGERKTPPISLTDLEGIVLDDTDAIRKGSWKFSRSSPVFVGAYYAHDSDSGKGDKTVTWIPEIKTSGEYLVRLYFPPQGNRASNVPVKVTFAGGEENMVINQRTNPQNKPYQTLGTFQFEKGTTGKVMISNAGTDGHVIADAVQFILVK
ncbi:Xanthan lyase precursor [Polystyrenella longa]|uniref:Xanthan lyase n=2 Tax=Polystyrenella longa TaxID=2528007 RepID=A0A518CNU3_9PLAN|nr:Xanthan lyase precursor [Polystyrenella longa]